jgi:serine/tyrosine/threonine adenylyltransferase
MNNIQTTSGWSWDNSYLNVNPLLYTKVSPTKVELPRLLFYNKNLANELGLLSELSSDVISALAGNGVLPGSEPIAQAYAGHQFGHFNILGDGRAILLGEHITPYGSRFDIQLKGVGRTPYSRNGDGRATTSAMLREYLISEAMHGLGIPTTRSLAVVGTGDEVYREYVSEGAVLTRVATSHIRVGTFQFASKYLPKDELRAFCAYVIERHYPEVAKEGNAPLAFLRKVQDTQIDLIVNWMRVGFIHGVMNTDNMSIPGETIDYGPCAFMNAYNPATVFSSIDRNSRYAYGNQPSIAQWNIACLASALIPIIHDDKDEAVKLCQEIINEFPAIYEQRWAKMMCSKLGILEEQEGDAALIKDLLHWMEANKVDYTNTFLQLLNPKNEHIGIYGLADFQSWFTRWEERVSTYAWEEVCSLLNTFNPKFIPRNHLVEEALHQAANLSDYGLVHRLLGVLQAPYEEHEGFEDFQEPPRDGDGGYQTYCGT